MPELTPDVEKLIRDEVAKELRRRIWQALAVIGAVNILAIVGLYLSVLGVAKTVAAETTTKAAQNAATNEIASKRSLINDIQQRLQKQSDTLTTAQTGMANLTSKIRNMKTLQSDASRDLGIANEQINRLSKLSRQLSGSDQTKVSQMIVDLNRAENAKQIIEKNTQLIAEINSIKTKTDRIAINPSGMNVNMGKNSLAIQTDGNLVIYDSSYKPIWQTNTVR